MADEPPYRPGDTAAAFVLHQDHVTVHTARIERVERHGARWRVTDNLAMQHDVDGHGHSGDFAPLDDLLKHELKTRGEGFVVLESGKLLDPPPLEQKIIEQDLTQELDGGRDGIS